MFDVCIEKGKFFLFSSFKRKFFFFDEDLVNKFKEFCSKQLKFISIFIWEEGMENYFLIVVIGLLGKCLFVIYGLEKYED